MKEIEGEEGRDFETEKKLLHEYQREAFLACATLSRIKEEGEATTKKKEEEKEEKEEGEKRDQKRGEWCGVMQYEVMEEMVLILEEDTFRQFSLSEIIKGEKKSEKEEGERGDEKEKERREEKITFYRTYIHLYPWRSLAMVVKGLCSLYEWMSSGLLGLEREEEVHLEKREKGIQVVGSEAERFYRLFEYRIESARRYVFFSFLFFSKPNLSLKREKLLINFHVNIILTFNKQALRSGARARWEERGRLVGIGSNSRSSWSNKGL